MKVIVVNQASVVNVHYLCKGFKVVLYNRLYQNPLTPKESASSAGFFATCLLVTWLPLAWPLARGLRQSGAQVCPVTRTGDYSSYQTGFNTNTWKAVLLCGFIKHRVIKIHVIEDNTMRCACPRKVGNIVEVRCGSHRTVTPLGRRIPAPAHPLHAHHYVLLCEWTYHALQTAPTLTSELQILVSGVLSV